MARIVVLGGSGFLGSRVVTALKKAGADVRIWEFEPFKQALDSARE